MKKILSIFGLIIFESLFSQNIPFDKLYGNSDPTHYYLSHYPVSSSDGLDINWYGGIRLQTSAGLGIQLLNNGNVGVGTTNPESKFTVHNNGAAGSTQFQLKTNHLRNGDRYFMKNSIFGTGTEDVTFSLRHDGQMFVDGNVGIGTATPIKKLDVMGDILTGATHATEGINAIAIRYDDGSLNNWGSLRSSGATYMSFGAKTDNVIAGGWLSSNGTQNLAKAAITLDNEGLHFLAKSQEQIALNSSVVMSELMKITPNGNAFLQGKLEAKELKVTLTPTADFVFEKDYNLPRLEEIEKHILEKKHLPEIASAKQMEKEGVNVGEFQIKLLQKIEELTLYVIQLNKDVKKLEEENKELNKKYNNQK
ncbi:hypothetical protein A0O34_08880 [Chryseobacterium glaciei]|uniref:Peptidase S74 domain-containing protein n=1 Tax=Chryseobacterium glaciei TaxID=1685010 RepID=A0A172XUC9_9FLAO|nr:hypothetical protein [Chryseobacterium glaciei]ANF50629.1 hypothetical protein A0O34_08880 [Chryseobacterium glaciei]